MLLGFQAHKKSRAQLEQGDSLQGPVSGVAPRPTQTFFPRAYVSVSLGNTGLHAQ